MKRKYYLRGLGFGILITALVFIIAGPKELSDEEIINRAEELGYVKAEEQVTPSIGLKELLETGTPSPTATSMPENTPEPTTVPEPEDTVTPVPTPTQEPVATITPTEVPQATNTPTPTNTPVPTSTPVPTTVPEEVITATIVVERGNTATVVCNKIEAAGIIKAGSELRKYLIDNRLTDYINVGTYSLSSDMTLKEIADILTER